MTEDKQPEDLIRYDVLTQEALRDVIRKVLEEVSVAGLPGEHHFFITFRTDHPGVRVSARMRERYPEEMTIVIQHSYWDLKVTETGFEIDLSFDEILERLRIPFSALKGFFDPHVKFGVQFDTSHLEAANSDGDFDEAEKTDRPATSSVPQVALTQKVAKKASKKKPATEGKSPVKSPAKTNAKTASKNRKASKEPASSGETAEIVSLDTFRKKK